MSQSYWLKSQSGNYSNDRKDTFDPSKNYIGVRLQNGADRLDRDWNELEDIRRYEEVMLRRWYIGDGTPDDGFKIAPAEVSNDFSISAGRCLVDGFEAVNESAMLYSKQGDVPALTALSGKRSDTVYLDLWITEISESEDPALMNSQDLRRETCRRHKVEWRVRVDEGRGKEGTVHSPQEEFHHYYDIARLERDGNNASIIDLRRIGLALFLLKDSSDTISSSLNALKETLVSGKVADSLHRHSRLMMSDGSRDPALSVSESGNIGIGTSSPVSKLQVAGDVVVQAIAKRPAGLNLPPGSTLIWNDGKWLRINQNYDWSAPIPGVHVPSLFAPLSLNVGGAGGWEDPGAGNVWIAGNVGIGTTNPLSKLQVAGDVVIQAIAKRPSRLNLPSGSTMIWNDGYWLRINQNYDWSAPIHGVHIPSLFAPMSLNVGGAGGWGDPGAANVWIKGRVGIGTTDMQRTLQVDGSEIHSGGSEGGFSFANRNSPNKGTFIEGGGDGQRWIWYSKDRIARLWSGNDKLLIDFNGNVRAASFAQQSDVRLKANITQLSGVLERLERIRGVSFEWNGLDPSGRSGGRREIGLIAQEVDEVFPELVTAWGDEGHLAINYSRLSGVLVEAIKELKAENESLREEIEALKNTEPGGL